MCAISINRPAAQDPIAISRWERNEKRRALVKQNETILEWVFGCRGNIT